MGDEMVKSLQNQGVHVWTSLISTHWPSVAGSSLSVIHWPRKQITNREIQVVQPMASVVTVSTRTHPSSTVINIIKQPYPTTSIRWAALAPLWSIPWGVEAQWQIIGALLQLRAMPRLGEAITHGRWSEMLDPSSLWDISSWTWSWGFRRLELRMYCSFKMPGLEKSVWFFGRYFLGVSKFPEHAVWWMTMTYHDSHAHRRVQEQKVLIQFWEACKPSQECCNWKKFNVVWWKNRTGTNIDKLAETLVLAAMCFFFLGGKRAHLAGSMQHLHFYVLDHLKYV